MAMIMGTFLLLFFGYFKNAALRQILETLLPQKPGFSFPKPNFLVGILDFSLSFTALTRGRHEKRGFSKRS